MGFAFRLKGFLNKMAQRGVGYPHALLKYYALRNYYFVKLPFRRSKYVKDIKQNNLLNATDLKASVSSLSDYFLNRKFPSFHFDRNQIGGIVQSVPDVLKDKTIIEANKVLRQSFNFRNIGEHVFEQEIDWSYAPKNHISWSWDLNRHAYFLDLAKAYYYTNKDIYIRHLIKLWDNWIERNPLSRTGNWSKPFEVASRLNNWIWVFFFIAYADLDSPPPLDKFLASMCEHAEYLHHSLEYHWPNNHLFLEAKALLAFALLFPEVKRQTKFLRRSAPVFKDQVMSQILPDGGHSELCSMYHLIVAGELQELVMIGRKNSLPDLVAPLEERLQASLKFSKALVRGDGSVPLFGDSALGDSNIRFCSERAEANDLSYWLFSESKMDQYTQDTDQNGLSVKVFPTSGYAFIRNMSKEKTEYSTFDFGSFSRNPVSDHAHNDALSFDIYARGRCIVADPGVCFFNDLHNIPHDYFRGTAAHNTVMIDDQEQSQLWRRSDVRKKARVSLVSLSNSEERVEIEASCSPYWAANGKTFHVRKIVYFSSGQVEVLDSVHGAGEHNLKWFFHFGPGIRVTTDEYHNASGMDEGGSLLFSQHVIASKRPTLRIVKGIVNPFQGWMSFNSSEVEAIDTAVYEIRVELPYQCKFIFSL